MALWTIAQVAAWASLTEGAARKKLDQLKVPYYDFGRGRGLGRRWDEGEAREAFNGLRSDRKRPDAKPERKATKIYTVQDLKADRKKLLAEMRAVGTAREEQKGKREDSR